jgi:uncharacterized membrane protein
MSRPPGPLWRRSSDELEFDRVAFFSDAIYAIALTLIAVGIGAPVVKDTTSASDFLDALWGKRPEIIAFFVSFAVLSFFWASHHSFFSRLVGVDGRLRTWNLLYLAFVAFLPFPSLLLGQYVDNAGAVSFFAVSVGAISAMETVMLAHAFRAGLTKQQPPPDIARWAVGASFVPVLCFAVSIPIAFVQPLLGIVAWTLSWPAQMVWDRVKPPGTDAYFA